MAVMGCGVEPRAPVLSPLPIPPPTHFTNVTDVKIFSKVIWTKSKRAATFFRETVPDSPCHRESENQYKEDEKEDDGTKGGRQDVQLGL